MAPPARPGNESRDLPDAETPALLQKITFKKRTRMFPMAVPSSILLLHGPRAAFECPAGYAHFSCLSCLFKLTTFSHKVNRDNLVEKPRLPRGTGSFPLFWAYFLTLWIWQKEFWVFFASQSRHCPFNLASLLTVFSTVLLQLSPAVKMIPDGFGPHAEHPAHLSKCHLGHFYQQNKAFFQ